KNKNNKKKTVKQLKLRVGLIVFWYLKVSFFPDTFFYFQLIFINKIFFNFKLATNIYQYRKLINRLI
ncbi:hypothetical protein, partial [Lactobacillus johnsonii]|uniref:hypothetical protein n=1 Tax=Lactobacillus johnsonii TaxID=33959 RepID=UPI001CBE595C